jgi:signal transduction histidine kinase
MTAAARRRLAWVLAWLLLGAAGVVAIARTDLERRRDNFTTDARIAHRLLSQRVVEHDAVLATLALLQAGTAETSPPEQRLPAVYPQVLRVQRRERGAQWPDARFAAAEVQSRRSGHAALAELDFAQGRYTLVLAAEPASYALQIDVQRMVPRSEWPLPPESPVRLALQHGGQTFTLQPGTQTTGPWRFDFEKHLASPSQPFDLVATHTLGWRELPWAALAGWVLAAGALLAALAAWQQQRSARRRAEELLRLGQVARLNTLGELAAGMAHELNQPLTAVLANTQAASRLLADEPPELDTARVAMAQAALQARRASDVVMRLRRTVERPDPQAPVKPVDLLQALRSVLYLVEPEARRCSVEPEVRHNGSTLTVMAEPVALEQIVHNLVINALQALQQVPPGQRSLALLAHGQGAQAVLAVQDSGPGMAPEQLARVFEPFFSTRSGGLGLGLSLCETLAAGMGGSLTCSNRLPQGAEFRLTLPLAPGAA